MMRGYQKNKLRREHPDYKSYTLEQKAQADESLVKISSATKKRGQTPIIYMGVENPSDFRKVTELLCAAAGIELYVRRNTAMGDVAKSIQEAHFVKRREAARQRLEFDVSVAQVDVPEERPARERISA
jgi:hypothetical protein